MCRYLDLWRTIKDKEVEGMMSKHYWEELRKWDDIPQSERVAKLKNLKARWGMTVADLSSAMKLSDATMYRLLSGERMISEQHLSRLHIVEAAFEEAEREKRKTRFR
jgi:hypothetical protein